jgi:ribosome-interacting GTPase 1
MGDDLRKDELNRSVEEHVRRLRGRLAEGRNEIARQREVVDSTREHIDGVRRWIQQTDRLRRPGGGKEAA